MVIVLRSVRNSLGGDLEVALRCAQRMVAGDLATVMSITGTDRYSLLRSLHEMQVRLIDMIGQVRARAENVNIGANEIAAGNTDLSQRTEEQAAALVQTASSMDHMTANVRGNADSAQRAAKFAEQAATIAAQGNEVVGNVVRTMGKSQAGHIKLLTF
jgi:methyl-accepting chemotaxis protein